jgi:hypothetical protein
MRVASSRSGSLRPALRNLLACTLLALVAAEQARAAQLQRLHVIALTLSANTRAPHADQSYRLIVFAHVRERVADLDNLVLPNLSGLEVTGGDRKRVAPAAGGGTNYYETIGVTAHQAGAMVIAPAYLEAIDARDGKAKRFLSNDLKIYVTGTQTMPYGSLTSTILGTALSILAWMVGLTIVVTVVTLVFLRPRGSPARPAPPATLALPRADSLAASPRDRLRNAAAELRAMPTRANALRVREAAWRLAGASGGETLSDVLRRPPAADAALRELLVAAERAAFTHDGDLAAAIGAVLQMLDRYLA